MKDWHFRDASSICLFRSAGILIRNGKMLVQCDQGVYAIPGGHVKIGETSEQTLVREYKEETGAEIVCERLLWVEETFWKWENRDAHGIVFYYLISLKNDDMPDNCFVSQKDNCTIALTWVPLEEIKKLEIYPTFIKNEIHRIPKNTMHMISVE